jgi:hypothetical protein
MRIAKGLGQDVLSGAVFILIGGFGLYIGRAYHAGTALEMGPGYIPRLLCGLMVGLGVLICAKGLFVGTQAMPRIHLRPLVFVIGSLLLFALLLVPAGLLLAAAASVVVASLAAQDSRTIEVILLAVGLTVAATLIFVVALDLPLHPFPIWER